MIAEDVPCLVGQTTQYIVNNQTNDTIIRIFAYLAVLTCLITIEIVRGQEHLPKQMSSEGLEELEEKYRMCSSQVIINHYTQNLKNSVLFKSGFRPTPISLDMFIAMFNTNHNNANEENLIFIDPVRFRYHYMVTFIHSNRSHF